MAYRGDDDDEDGGDGDNEDDRVAKIHFNNISNGKVLG
jgi:hypothetical protein